MSTQQQTVTPAGVMVERGKSPFGIRFMDYNPMAYPGSMSLPPVICRTFTGLSWTDGMKIEDLRWPFITEPRIGLIDAPNRLPAGSHCAPRITCNGLPVFERPASIYPREVARS